MEYVDKKPYEEPSMSICETIEFGNNKRDKKTHANLKR